MTQGVLIAGGSLRAGQAYAVNGQRPESNDYLLDGAANVNRVDGSYAVKTSVDAVQEFRIITGTAPAEYGGTAGATTTVISRSGGNAFHGAVYEFLRNDAFDARNFFSSGVEPLKQNQFGATAGGPIRANRDFFFGYYEDSATARARPAAPRSPATVNAPAISQIWSRFIHMPMPDRTCLSRPRPCSAMRTKAGSVMTTSSDRATSSLCTMPAGFGLAAGQRT